MKKIIAAFMSIIMITSPAFAVSAQEPQQDSAQDFYQALESIITAAGTQDSQADAEHPEGFPTLAEPAFLYKAGDEEYNLDGQEIIVQNGIILQMMDDDAVSGDAAEAPAQASGDAVSEDEDQAPGFLLEEAPGFLTMAYADGGFYELTQDTAVDPAKTYYVPDPENEGKYMETETPSDAALSSYYELNPGTCRVVLNITHGEYEGDIYNATGYYSQAPDFLTVNIATGAVLTGDIALTSHVHGMMTAGLDIDEMTALLDSRKAGHEEGAAAADAGAEAPSENGEDVQALTPVEPDYVFMDKTGEITSDKEAVSAVQFTKIYDGETFLLGKVINSLNYNGAARADVTVQGSWTVKSASLLTSLTVEEGALVYGEIAELADGSLLLIPSEETLKPGTYGIAAQ